jgi:ABC-2 type transport system ATP-binding protein
MLLGLKAPSAGTLRLLGEPVAGRPGPLLGRIGCLVEHPSLYPHLTAAENLRITCRMRNLGAREIPKALALVGLEASTHQLVSTFSLGMRQRLGLALAWLGEPELLILDRPTNGLDPAGMHWISSRWASMAVSIGSGMLGLIGPSSS